MDPALVPKNGPIGNSRAHADLLLIREIHRANTKYPLNLPNQKAGPQFWKIQFWKLLNLNIASVTNKSMKEATYYDDLFTCTRPLLITGKVFGLLPLQGLFQRDLKNVKFKWLSGSAIFTLFQLLVVAIVALFSCMELFKHFFGVQQGERSSHLMILETRAPLFLTSGTLIYLTFLLKGKKMIQLFHRWRTTSSAIMFHEEETKTFRKINILAFGSMIPTAIHGFIYRLNFIGVFDYTRINKTGARYTNMTALEVYYNNFCPHLSENIGYNMLTVMLIMYATIIALAARVFSETLILVMSKLLYRKFQILYVQTQLRVTPVKSHNVVMFRKTSIETMMKGNLWLEVRKDHLICLHLLWEAEKILSPIVLISFAMDLYLICMQIHQGILPSSYEGCYVKALLAFITIAIILSRLIVMSLNAARIHDYAHAINMCIQKCPNQLYSSELERLERMLSNSTVGLSGMGCFVVTRAFLLVMGSVIFTVEIVLMTTPGMIQY